MKLRERKKNHQKQFVYKKPAPLVQRLKTAIAKIRLKIFTNEMQISYARVSIWKLKEATEFKDPASIVYFTSLIDYLIARADRLNEKLNYLVNRYVSLCS